MKRYLAGLLAAVMLLSTMGTGALAEPVAETNVETIEAQTSESPAQATEEKIEERQEEKKEQPAEQPTVEATKTPAEEPAEKPSAEPTVAPAEEPTEAPEVETMAAPSEQPTAAPSEETTVEPSEDATVEPSEDATVEPSEDATVEPSEEATAAPSEETTVEPSEAPAVDPRTAAELAEALGFETVEALAEAMEMDVSELEALSAEEIAALYAQLTDPSLQAAALAASDFTVENGVLTAYTGSDVDVVIPGDLGITVIGSDVFKNAKIQSVVIPEGVTEIGSSAFSQCQQLTSVRFPSTLKKIGDYAFYLSEVIDLDIPGSVTTIGKYAFASCMRLETIRLNEGLETIGTHAFEDSRKISSVQLPESLTTLGYWAFAYTGVESVTISGGIGVIPSDAFHSCPSLAVVTISEGITEIKDGAFLDCPKLATVQLPSTLKKIGMDAFRRDALLREINLPEGLESIGNSAFSDCSALESIEIPASVTTIEAGAFQNCAKLTARVYPDSVALTYCQTNSIPYVVLVPKGVHSAQAEQTSIDAQDCASAKFTVTTSKDTRSLKLCDEAGAQVAVFTAENAQVAASGDELTWTFDYTFAEDGERQLTLIAATADGDCEAWPIAVSLSGARMKSAAFQEAVLEKDKAAQIRATTNVGADTLCMYDEAGKMLCSWAAEGNSAVSGGDRVWSVTYAFAYTGTRQMTFHALCNGVGGQTSVKAQVLVVTLITPDFTVLDSALIAYTGSDVDVVIPGDLGIRSIGGGAFKNTKIQSVVIPWGVMAIGDSAFSQCGQLTSVTLPGTLERIGAKAFYEDSQLREINFPSDLEKIGESAFYKCASLTKIVLPAGVETVQASTFQYATSLSSVNLGAVETLKSYAFANCSALKSIEIPASVTSIEGSAFWGCDSLLEARVYPNSAALTHCQRYGIYYLIQAEGLSDFLMDTDDGDVELVEYRGSDADVVIPGDLGITIIGSEAFKNAKIQSVVIPEGVTEIGSSAFSQCQELTSVRFPSTLKKIGEQAFEGCNKITSLDIPGSVTTIGNHAFVSCTRLETLQLNEGLETIGSNAFSLCNALSDVRLPASLTTLGEYAFASGGIKSVTISGAKCAISNSAFSDCSSLAEVTIFEGTTKIGDSAFLGCKNLTKVQLPSTLTTIGASAFRFDSQLREINFPEGLVSIGISAFDSTGLTEIVLPSTLETVGGWAFSYCKNLTKVQLPSTLTTIGNNAFEADSQLREINLPEGLVSIGDSAFSGSGLTEIVLPSTLETVGGYAFSGNTSLRSVDLGNVQTLRKYAFVSCSALESIEIPASVTTIETGVFENCARLTARVHPNSAALTYCQENSIPYVVLLPQAILSAKAEQTGIDAQDRAVATFTVTTSKDTLSLKLCDEAGAQVAVFTAENAQVVASDDGLTWTFDYAFAEDGERELSLIAATADGDCAAWPIAVSLRGAQMKSAAFQEAVVEKGKPAQIRATTSMGADTLCMYDEAGEMLCSWPAEGNSTVSGGDRVWNVTYAFAYAGTRQMTFRALCNGAGGQTSVEAKVLVATLVTPDFTVLNGVLIAYTGSETDVVIPADLGVTAIGDRAFANSGIQSVVIPGSVTTIGKSAFVGCGNLKTIQLNEGLKTIGEAAFYECGFSSGTRLNVQLPESLTTLGDRAFAGTNVTSVTIPGSVSAISEGTFEGCTLLEEVIISEGVTEIKFGAFASCSKLATVKLPSTLKSIGSNAFSSDSKLLEIELPEGLTRIGSYAFSECTGLTKIVFPSTLEYVSDEAFSGDYALRSVDLANVIWLGYYAFARTDLRSVEIPGTLSGNDSDNLDAMRYTFSGCSALTRAVIDEGVVNIYPYMFADCTSLTEVKIPSTVKRICGEAFINCSALEYIEIPATVTTIESYAFKGCESLTVGVYPGSAALTYCQKNNIPYVVVLPQAILDAKAEQTGLDAQDRAMAKFTVKTTQSAQSLKLCNEMGEQICVFTPEEALVVASDDELTWTFDYTFAEDGERQLTLIAATADGDCEAWPIAVSLRCAQMKSAAFQEAVAEKGKPAQIRAYTSIGADTLCMYSENGALIRTWPAEGNSTVANGERVWSVTYTFVNAGTRTMTFRALSSGAGGHTSARVQVKVELPVTLDSVSASKATVTAKETLTFTVQTSANAKYVRMHSEGGYLVKSWAAEGNSTVSGSARIWKLAYAFGGVGERMVTFRASEDGSSFTEGRSVPVTVLALPSVTGANASATTVTALSTVTLTATTPANGYTLALYAEGDSFVKSWSCDGNSTVSGNVRTWSVQYAFGGTGNRRVTLKASADGANYGSGRELAVTVLAVPNVTSAAASKATTTALIPVTLTATTPANGSFLTLYAEGGTKVKTWSCDGNSTVNGNVRTWTVDYAFGGAGNRRITLKASADGANYGSGRELAVTVLAVPNVTSAAASKATATAQETLTLTATTPVNGYCLTLYAEGGTKVKTWNCGGNSTVNGNVRTWKVQYAFGGTGDRRVTLKASADGVHCGSGKELAVTVLAVPNVTAAEFTGATVNRGEVLNIHVTAPANGTCLHMYLENGQLYRTWSSEGNSVVSGGNRFWNVSYSFSAAGMRRLTFRVSADGVHAGAGMTASITVK